LKSWVLALAAPWFTQIICYAWILRGYNASQKFARLLFPGVLAYWLLYMCASLYAVCQFVVYPFYWNKTDHGPAA
jgi:hypothetical protein